jgi:hypothetical protein
MDLLFESVAIGKNETERVVRISPRDVWLQSRLLCSLQRTKGKRESREGNRRNERQEENKGEDQTDVIVISRNSTPPSPDLARAYTHTHTHTYTHTHAPRQTKFIKTRNWLLRLSETYNRKKKLFNTWMWDYSPSGKMLLIMFSI